MQFSRRAFLGTLGATGAIAAFPGFGGCMSLGAKGANGKVNLAFIGLGNRGAQVYDEFAKYADLYNVVAVCDTEIGKPGAKFPVLARAPQAPRYQDFRKMFDAHANEIDAVVICTPDSSHFAATMGALQLGKHVYVEKPMAHTFQEVDLMQKLAARQRVVTQMGNQGHTSGHYDQTKHLAEQGFLKGVKRIDAFMDYPRRWHKWNGHVPASAYSKMAVPDWLDWNAWLAQNADKDFNVNYLNGDWRCWFDYGNGVLGDWGAHIFDCLHEFMDLGLPTEIEMVDEKGPSPLVFPMACTMRFHFANGCVINWHEGIGNLPEFVRGELAKGVKSAADGSIPSSGKQDYTKETSVPPGKVVYLADGTVLRGNSHDSTFHVAQGGTAALAAALKGYPRESDKWSHQGAFLHAIKGDCKAHSDFAKAGVVSKLITLGCVAQRLHASLKYDSAANRFTNNEAANQFLALPPRKGWETFYRI